jgi:hypothetical protein
METAAEAAMESRAMDHAVERYFKDAEQEAANSYVPPKTGMVFEQGIGKKDHIQKVMPVFVTLRNRDGKALVTAMLPPQGKDERALRPIVVGPGNSDPYPEYGEAISALAKHSGLQLDRERCFPYRRR